MGSPQGGPRTDGGKAAFLHDLRALRDRAGLDQAELAARAHYPVGTLRAAERGPVLPTLPVLEAYVRACGADPADWEDRWRQLSARSATTLLAPGGEPGGRPDGSPDGQRGGPPGEQTPPGEATAPARTVLLSLGYLPRRRRIAITLAGAALVAMGAAVAGVVLPAGPPGSPAAHRAPRAAAPPVAAPSAPPVSSRPPGTSRPRRTAGRPAPAPSSARTGAALTGRSVPVVVAGVGCPDRPGSGFTLAGGPPGPGWTGTDGGWTGNGCDGATVWSHSPPGGPGAGNSFTWFFRPSPGASACTLAVFVPTMDSGGLADYAVSAGPASGGSAASGASLGTVAVDQAASADQWVTLGRYPASGGSLFIRLTAAAAASGPPGQAAGAEPPGQARKAGGATGPGSAVAASAASAACF